MASISKRYADNVAASNDQESTGMDTDVPVKNAKIRKYKGAAAYKVVYKAEWEKEFPIRAVPNDKHKFHCIPCDKNVTCHHQGLGDVKTQCGREIHKKNSASWKRQKTLCAKTKTSAILNEAFAPHCHKYVVEHCKTHAYGVGTDGSNDTGVAKLNPVSIRIFDIDRSKTVTNHIFDMCLTEGEHGAKAFKIFEAIEEKFVNDSMLWSNCVSLSTDNTNR